MESHGDSIRQAPIRWINVLLKGEQNPEDETDDYITEMEARNLTVIKVSPLRFVFKNLDKIAARIEKLEDDREGKASNGLVLTSPRAVDVMVEAINKTQQGRENLKKFNPHLVFVVGPKTGKYCMERLGLNYNFESAEAGNLRALSGFLRTVCHGYVAPVIIYPVSDRSELGLIFNSRGDKFSMVRCDAYSTETISDLHDKCLDALEKLVIPGDRRRTVVNLIFFSPSGVQGFVNESVCKFEEKLRDIFHECDQLELKYSAIGETTGFYLREEKMFPFCVSPKPTATALSEALATNISKYQATNLD